MKRTTKRWTLRIAMTGLLIMGMLFGLMLNPTILYAKQTTIGNFTVYHQNEIDETLSHRLEKVTSILSESELYDPSYRLNICLNDGSSYPIIMEKIRGQAFGWGFYKNVVLEGESNIKSNYVELNGYRWNLEQLIAHEAIHCYQYHELGIWNSNPLANYPNWKWEGYPEYVARQTTDQEDLFESIQLLIQTEKEQPGLWAIEFSDGTISPVNYYKDWLLVKYCLDIKKLSYKELLNDSTERVSIEEEMMDWFQTQNQASRSE